MKTKIIKPLLAIACLLSSFSASAYDFEVDGIYYDVVSFSDLTCMVVKDENISYKGDIVIPAKVNYSNKTLTVVEVGKKAFYGCNELTGITIPNTVTSVGSLSFYDCIKLERVKIEDGETELKFDYYKNYEEFITSFINCPIKSLYVGRNLLYDTSKKTTTSPFYSNENIEDLTIGNSVTEIGRYAFDGCSGITSVTIPNSVTKIGRDAFYGCNGLTSVTIGNSVTEIGGGAFYGCSGLTSVTIPNSVTKIGESAFCKCYGLTSVTIGNSVTEIGGDAFYGCGGLTSVTIPNSVTKIGEGAFYGCNGLTSVTIGNSVTEIGRYAFYGCSGLTSVTIPNSVTEIGIYAFDGCSGLTSVTIGNSVTKIGGGAFTNCDGLTELYLYGITPPKVSDKNFTNNQYMTLNVYVPQEALEVYQSSDVWKNFWNLQGFDATGIKGIDIDGKDTKGRCFDLRGNRLDAPKSGVNIINGRKVMVK